MGYTFAWDDLIKICQALSTKQENNSVWKGIGSDSKMRTCTVHAKHKGPIGDGLINEIAKKQLLFKSKQDMYRFLKEL